MIMSQYRIKKGEKTIVYGFDRCIPEYFLWVQDDEDTVEELVGCLGNLSGTNGHMIQAIAKLDLVSEIPKEHLELIGNDLPI